MDVKTTSSSNVLCGHAAYRQNIFCRTSIGLQNREPLSANIAYRDDADVYQPIAYVFQVGDVVSGELPPIWVPLVVVAVLGVGVGLLQRSLGDVMEDEAKLGSISGARAAKESARDRNMFKKKK